MSLLDFKRSLGLAALAGVAVLGTVWDSRIAVVTTLLLANVATFVFWSALRMRSGHKGTHTRSPDKLYRLWFAPMYYFLALYLLWHIAPITHDGSGPGPGLYWGKQHLPSEDEYYRHHIYFLLRFAIPYLATALALTALGCAVAPAIARRLKWFSSKPLIVSMGTTLVFTLVPAAISDAGVGSTGGGQ